MDDPDADETLSEDDFTDSSAKVVAGKLVTARVAARMMFSVF